MAKARKTKGKAIPAKLRWHATPLRGSFMLIAILGFLISAYIVYPRSYNFGTAFLILFAAMFTASLISMSKAPVVES